MHYIILQLSLIHTAISPFKNSLSLLIVIFILSFVDVAITPNLSTFIMFQVIHPVSFIEVTTFVDPDTTTMAFVCRFTPLSQVFGSI